MTIPSSSPVRDRLLDAAEALIEASGPAGTDALTTRAVCDRAGVTAPTLYHHFGDKDGLVTAVLGRAAEAFLAAKQATGEESDPLVAFRAGWGAWTAFVVARPAVFALALTRPEVVRAAVDEADALMRSRLEALAAEGRLAVPLDVVAGACRAAVHGVASLAASGAPSDHVEAVSTLLRDGVLKGSLETGGEAA